MPDLLANVIITGLILTIPTRTAPTGTSEPPYVPDPKDMGTVSLLTSCSITFSFCEWTAIHPNIPRPGIRRYAQKLGWAALAILAPEVVLCRAIAQW